MNFALIGSDVESHSLAAAAVEAGHTIAWGCDLTAVDGREIPDWLEDVPADPVQHDQWSALSNLPEVDAVIVGRGNAPPDLRTEQLCQLARQDSTVLATHPVVPSVLSYFEIDMARGETGAVFRHYHPIAEHPITVQLADWISSGHPELGAVQQIVCERTLAERSREKVLWHFSRDVIWLARIAGGLDRLGAFGSPAEQSSVADDASYAALSVQMTGKLERAVRWSVGPVDKSAGLYLSLIGEQGRLVLVVDEVGRPRRLSLNVAGHSSDLPLESSDYSPASEAIRAMVKTIDTPDDQSSKRDYSTWREALSAMELTDTIEISLRRGRMIDVHQQQLTEHMAFKEHDVSCRLWHVTCTASAVAYCRLACRRTRFSGR